MRITTTAVLAGIVLVLAGVIHFINREPVPTGGIGNLLTKFEPRSVDNIVIKQSGSNTVIERSEAGEWRFVEPITDRVNPAAISTLLDQLNHLAILDKIERREIGGTDEISAGDMGLDASRLIRVELSGEGDGDELKPVDQVLLIGTEAGIANAVYARLPDAKEKEKSDVFVVDGNPRKTLANPIESIRDPRLLGTAPERLVKIVVKTGQGEVDIQRKITPPMYSWTITKPITALANQKLMDSLAAGLGAIRVVDVLEDGEPGEIPNPVPDDSIAMDIVFYGDDIADGPIQLFLKPHYVDGKISETEDGKPILEASISNRPARFLVESDLLDTLPQSPNSYRDLHLLQVNGQTLQRILIRSRTQAEIDLRSTVTPEGLLWNVVVNGKLEPANQGRINMMINAINETQIIDFVTDSQARLGEYGLQPAAVQITFQNYQMEGQKPEDAVRVLQLGRNPEEEEKLFANLISRPNIFEVPQSLQREIPTHISNWKSLKILNFSEYHLKKITRERPDEPTISLEYFLQGDSWKVTRGGKDVSKNLDKGAAKKLRTRLGSLTATGWVVALGTAYQRLQEPSTTLKIETTELDENRNERIVERVLNFAPANPDSPAGVYYGRIEGSNDVFVIDAKTYRELINPLLMTSVSPE